jgi:hypothetical protein
MDTRYGWSMDRLQGLITEVMPVGNIPPYPSTE